MDFCWEDTHDQYDISQVSRRRVKRWSRLNMKARKKAKKQYNEKVRSLAQNAKRLDRRVRQMAAKREEERKREMEEEKERRKRLKKEKMEKAAREYEEPEWTKVVERRRKYGDPEEEEKVKERDEWECVVCRKVFKSEKQCKNHEQSKKHRRMVSELLELHSKHHNELDKEEVSQEDEVVGINHEELSNGVGDDKWENYSEAAGFQEEEEEEAEAEAEEEVDEMEALLALVSIRRKTGKSR